MFFFLMSLPHQIGIVSDKGWSYKCSLKAALKHTLSGTTCRKGFPAVPAICFGTLRKTAIPT